MLRPTCETCAYWESDLDGGLGGAGRSGSCHRRSPPLPLIQIRQNNDDDTDDSEWGYLGKNTFPETDHLDWCGEHPYFPAYLASLAPCESPQVKAGGAT